MRLVISVLTMVFGVSTFIFAMATLALAQTSATGLTVCIALLSLAAAISGINGIYYSLSK